MNKKLITAVMAAVLSITTINMAKANPAPATVAIIDTAFNNNIPSLKSNLVYEVCIIDWDSCANGKKFMEGPGAASMPQGQIGLNGFDHGTKMVSAAVQTNPNVKIVFIRVVGATSNGVRQITNGSTFDNALTWVLNNKDRFNIQAVAMSQSHHNVGPAGTNYCPPTPSTESIINQLSNVNIPVFLPGGNNRDSSRISWPACIPASIAVSASDNNGIAIYANYDTKLTDFYAQGTLTLITTNGQSFREAGSSVSTQVAASLYMMLKEKNQTYTLPQMIDLLKSKSVKLQNRRVIGLVLDKNVISRG